jgi:WD40 repeat protein
MSDDYEEDGNAPPFLCEGDLRAHAGLVTAITFSSCGAYFFSASADKLVRLWNAATKALVQTYAAHGWDVADVAVYVLPAQRAGRRLRTN